MKVLNVLDSVLALGFSHAPGLLIFRFLKLGKLSQNGITPYFQPDQFFVLLLLQLQ